MASLHIPAVLLTVLLASSTLLAAPGPMNSDQPGASNTRPPTVFQSDLYYTAKDHHDEWTPPLDSKGRPKKIVKVIDKYADGSPAHKAGTEARQEPSIPEGHVGQEHRGSPPSSGGAASSPSPRSGTSSRASIPPPLDEHGQPTIPLVDKFHQWDEKEQRAKAEKDRARMQRANNRIRRSSGDSSKRGGEQAAASSSREGSAHGGAQAAGGLRHAAQPVNPLEHPPPPSPFSAVPRPDKQPGKEFNNPNLDVHNRNARRTGSGRTARGADPSPTAHNGGSNSSRSSRLGPSTPSQTGDAAQHVGENRNPVIGPGTYPKLHGSLRELLNEGKRGEGSHHGSAGSAGTGQGQEPKKGGCFGCFKPKVVR